MGWTRHFSMFWQWMPPFKTKRPAFKCIDFLKYNYVILSGKRNTPSQSSKWCYFYQPIVCCTLCKMAQAVLKVFCSPVINENTVARSVLQYFSLNISFCTTHGFPYTYVVYDEMFALNQRQPPQRFHGV